MNITKNKITIVLEEGEIETFWNVIAFSLDLDAEKKCMTEQERDMANRLYKETDR